MLRYFGEKEAAECGRCDYCRARRSSGRQHVGLDPDAVLDDIMAVIEAGGCGYADVQAFAGRYGSRQEEALEILRRLEELGKVALEGRKIRKI